jgi:hypothetical protein
VRCSCVGMMWKLMCFWYESLAVVSCHYTFQSSNEKVVQLTVSFFEDHVVSYLTSQTSSAAIRR